MAKHSAVNRRSPSSSLGMGAMEELVGLVAIESLIIVVGVFVISSTENQFIGIVVKAIVLIDILFLGATLFLFFTGIG